MSFLLPKTRGGEEVKILTSTIDTINGKLYSLTNGRRCLKADTDVKIECYEENTELDVMGMNKCKIKKSFYKLVICDNLLCKFDLNSSYEVVCDYLREDGIYKRLYLNNIVPIEIEDNKWTFTCDSIDF